MTKNRPHLCNSFRAVASARRCTSEVSIRRSRGVMKSVKLSSGHEMPTVGLGTWQVTWNSTEFLRQTRNTVLEIRVVWLIQAKPEEVEAAVGSALENGYRHIDTAFNYNNEEAIGASLKRWFKEGGKREDLFVTTKVRTRLVVKLFLYF